MAREVKQWITVNGHHVPVFEGESKAEVVKRAVNKQKSSDEEQSKKEYTENQERQNELKQEIKRLEKHAFNKDAKVVLDELRAREDEHRRFEADKEDMDERLEGLKKKEKQLTKTDAFNPQARSTLKDLRARIDEIQKIKRNDEHEIPVSKKVQSKDESAKEKQIKENKKQADERNGKTIEVNGRKIKVKKGENNSQAIYRNAQEEQGKPLDEEFYKELGDTKIPGKSRSKKKKESLAQKFVKASETKKRLATQKKDGKIDLESLRNYGYDPADVTGDPTVINADGKSYYKIGEDKWKEHSSNGRVLSDSISSRQLSDKLADAKEIKVMPSKKYNVAPAAAPGSKLWKKWVKDNNQKDAGWKLNNYNKSSLIDLAYEAGIPDSQSRAMSTDELRQRLLAMWKKG